MIATAQVTVIVEDYVAATCLTSRSLEGLHTNTAVVSNQVNTGSSIQAWVRAAFIHIWGQQRWGVSLSPTMTILNLARGEPSQALPVTHGTPILCLGHSPVSHVAPVYPAWHTQAAELLSAWHWPPF